MKLTVCIGSSCYLKGSHTVVEQLQKIIAENDIKEKIDLCGSFCMGQCRNGVNVKVNDEIFSVSPETVNDFFEKEVKPRL